MRTWWASLAAMALFAAPAAASTDIPADPGKDWKHKPTGTRLPPTLAGLKRTQVAYFTAPEVDVAANYWSHDGNDTITVYLFRNVSGDVPVWFDRSRYFILNLPDKYGAVRATGTRAFTPRGQSVPSGLMESFETGRDLRTTALAVFPFGDFYAKLRVSSKTRDLAGIEALLIETANSFNWSSPTGQHRAVPVMDCASPLAARPPATLIEGSDEDRMTAGVLGGLFAQMASSDLPKEIRKAPEPVSVFCREPGESSLSYGMYRADGNTQRYTLAVHDGGRAITVGRNDLAALLGGKVDQQESKAAGTTHFTVTMVHLDKVETYSDFSSLPLPAQAVELVENSQPVSVAGTWGKQANQITVITE